MLEAFYRTAQTRRRQRHRSPKPHSMFDGAHAAPGIPSESPHAVPARFAHAAPRHV